jgi:hypothetical protein
MAPKLHTYRNAGRPSTARTTTTIARTNPEAVPESMRGVPRPLGYSWAEPGTEVWLSEECGYAPTHRNPIRGSEHGCKGKIHTLIHTPDNSKARPVSVQWENGTTNRYFFEDLDPVRRKYEIEYFTSTAHDAMKSKQQEEKKGPMFNKGDIVFLKPGFESQCHEQPALGTLFQCPGIVKSALHAKIKVEVYVKWHNSLISRYDIRYDWEKNPAKCPLINGENGEQLKQFIKENPNFAYKVTRHTGDDDFGVLTFFRTAMGIEEESNLEKMEDEQYHAECLAISDDAPEAEEPLEDHETQYVTFDFEAPPEANFETPTWNPTREFLNEHQEGNDTTEEE